MTTLPASLRRILDKRKPEPVQNNPLTLIWRDGEVWRKEPGKNWRQLPDAKPIHD